MVNVIVMDTFKQVDADRSQNAPLNLNGTNKNLDVSVL